MAACIATVGWSQTTDSAEAEAASPTETSAQSTEANEHEEAAAEEQTLVVHESKLQFTVPAAWKVVKPRNNIIDMELQVPASEGDEPSETAPVAESPAHQGRLTMMAAGGDVDANIRRWVGQFRLGRDADGKDAMRRDRHKLRGAVAHVLDIAGTYFDSPQGPMGPKVELPNYRMLGAVIEVEGSGKYFVKFYGPAKIVEENRAAFEHMLSSMQVVEPSEQPPAETTAPPQEEKQG